MDQNQGLTQEKAERNGDGPAAHTTISTPQPASFEVAQSSVVPDSTAKVSRRPARRARISRRTWIFGSALLVIVVAIAGAVRYFHTAAAHPTTDDAYVQGDVVSIGAKVSGRVSRVLVHGDERVTRGQPLVQLDPTDARIAVAQAQAALEAARAQAASARAALVTQEHQTPAAIAQARAAAAAADAQVPQAETTVTLQDRTVQQAISTARAQLEAATANTLSAHSAFTKAEHDLTRAKQLFAQGAVSAQDVDQAQAAYDAALAQQKSAEDAVTQARAAVASAEASQLQVPIHEQAVLTARAQAAAAVAGIATASTGYDVIKQKAAAVANAAAAAAQALAQLAAAQQQLADTVVVAPADAQVGSQVAVQPGQVVVPGQALMTLIFSNTRWVEANFKETQLGRVRVGQPVTVRVDLLGLTFHGHVRELGAATGSVLSLLPAENATGNFTKVVQRVPVRIALDDAPAKPLAVGLSAEVTIDTTRNPAAFVAAEPGRRAR